jgi:hypothetical protein
MAKILYAWSGRLLQTAVELATQSFALERDTPPESVNDVYRLNQALVIGSAFPQPLHSRPTSTSSTSTPPTRTGLSSD